MRSPRKYWLRINIGSTWRHQLVRSIEHLYWCGVRVGYTNPKTMLNRAFVSLHFGSMRWCYIFNCVYCISGIYRPKLWLDSYDYEHLIWPWLLLHYMWLMMWYTGLYTYNGVLLNHLYWTYLLRVPTASALHLHPQTKRIYQNTFTIGVRSGIPGL